MNQFEEIKVGVMNVNPTVEPHAQHALGQDSAADEIEEVQAVTSISAPVDAQGQEFRARDVRWLRVGAELVGTFLICAVLYFAFSFGQIVLGQPTVILPAIGTALVYMAVTAMLGSVSGGHFNPAVTVAAMFTSQVSLIDGLLYIVAQILGALGAGILLIRFLPVTQTIPAKTWLMFVVNGFDANSPAAPTLSQQHISFGAGIAIIVELVGSLIVVGAAIATMRSDGTARKNHALYTGIAYGAGTLIAYPITNAALNPARATGVAVFAQSKQMPTSPISQLWLFWICPLLAASLVALAIIVSGIVTDSMRNHAKDAAIAETVAETAEDSDGDSYEGDSYEVVSAETTESHASDADSSEVDSYLDGLDDASQDDKGSSDTAL